ncbi:hypothetical protein GF376_01020 [Candidatus Peregrinibacteria bacterium]|nr:hypothetical protein [Candidatus Peregrinibacteria bacterium]
MKNNMYKLFAAGLFLFLLMPLANAQESKYQENSPKYLLLTWGSFNLQDNQALKTFEGSITGANADFTVAKNIGINTDESLSSESGDLGLPSSEINFETKSVFFEGILLKVYPHVENQDNGKLSLEINEQVQEYDLESLDQIDQKSVGGIGSKALEIRIENIHDSKGAEIDQVEASFAHKYKVLSKMTAVIEWAQKNLDQADLDDITYQRFEELFFKAMDKDYTAKELQYFEWRFQRLAFALKREKISPRMFYIGLNRLVERGV